MNEFDNPWDLFDRRPSLASIPACGVDLKPGDRVRLRPVRQADIFDLALDGKSATIESIEQDYEGQIHLSVTIDDDPGRDLGRDRKPGHRFFFRPEEVQPLSNEEQSSL